jgi:hypothetical protein
MVNKGKQYPTPEFDSLEEEDKYWRSHSPLLEGYEGKAQKKKQNRASFLSIRLTGEELAQLRDRAMRYGLGPSTYARQILVQAMGSGENYLPPELLFHVSNCLGEFLGEKQDEYYQTIKEIYNEYLKTQKTFAKEITNLCFPRVLEQISLLEQSQNRSKEVK